MYNLVISEIAGGDTFLGRASETKKDPCGGGVQKSNGIQESLGARMRLWRATARETFR